MRSFEDGRDASELLAAQGAENDVALPFYVAPIAVQDGSIKLVLWDFWKPAVHKIRAISAPDPVFARAVVVPLAPPELLSSSTGIAEADELFAGLNPRHQNSKKKNLYGDFAASGNYLLRW